MSSLAYYVPPVFQSEPSVRGMPREETPRTREEGGGEICHCRSTREKLRRLFTKAAIAMTGPMLAGITAAVADLAQVLTESGFVKYELKQGGGGGFPPHIPLSNNVIPSLPNVTPERRLASTTAPEEHPAFKSDLDLRSSELEARCAAPVSHLAKQEEIPGAHQPPPRPLLHGHCPLLSPPPLDNCAIVWVDGRRRRGGGNNAWTRKCCDFCSCRATARSAGEALQVPYDTAVLRGTIRASRRQCPVAPSLFKTRSEIGSKIDTENCCTIRVQSWTGDREEEHFEQPKLEVRDLDPRSAAIIRNHEMSLVRHFYIGTKIKLDPGSELGSLDLRPGKTLVQPGISEARRRANNCRSVFVLRVGDCFYNGDFHTTLNDTRRAEIGDIRKVFAGVCVCNCECVWSRRARARERERERERERIRNVRIVSRGKSPMPFVHHSSVARNSLNPRWRLQFPLNYGPSVAQCTFQSPGCVWRHARGPRVSRQSNICLCGPPNKDPPRSKGGDRIRPSPARPPISFHLIGRADTQGKSPPLSRSRPGFSFVPWTQRTDPATNYRVAEGSSDAHDTPANARTHFVSAAAERCFRGGLFGHRITNRAEEETAACLPALRQHMPMGHCCCKHTGHFRTPHVGQLWAELVNGPTSEPAVFVLLRGMLHEEKNLDICACTNRLPPRRTGFDSGVAAPGYSHVVPRAGRCRWSAGFLADLPLHSGATPYSPDVDIIGSRDLDKSRPNFPPLHNKETHVKILILKVTEKPAYCKNVVTESSYKAENVVHSTCRRPPPPQGPNSKEKTHGDNRGPREHIRVNAPARRHLAKPRADPAEGTGVPELNFGGSNHPASMFNARGGRGLLLSLGSTRARAPYAGRRETTDIYSRHLPCLLEWYADNNVRQLDWPTQSPDLSSIEHLWGELHLRARARQARPKSIAQLMEWLQEEWQRIPVDVLQILVESMPDRVAAVIAARGGPTRS
ncbi:hypothetical protein PR048_004365 [Dryococelus australis]|uniref:Uncharacterized protein n=1 Tax=Dryococelus australis TaxID=614101 RepID=A0ABQ9I591_9NEOP|nr:hypothetical protein PR048_004365 [Dryococelus australis]